MSSVPGKSLQEHFYQNKQTHTRTQSFSRQP